MNYFLKSKHIVSSLFGLVLFLSCSLSYALELPLQDTVPGGIAIIKLNENSDTAPKVSYKNRPVMVVKYQQAWHALVGIPLTAKIGQHNISSKHAGKSNNYTFQITDKQYETQHLTIKNKRKVNPNADDMKRIGKETKKDQSRPGALG